MPDTDGRLTRIETKLAFLEDAVNELVKASAAQEERLERLQAESRALRDKYRDLLESGEELPHQKPPHY
ncbi:SlyX family protein [Treponema endosymbiont of Eucomonympha sp.]|uniref:SlyX family protein n=1 Tax=Treponema endosymbiont of Eucomonympha sp. TaxID=1580831 RepID=UPI0007842A60|nr:SlyX family protein [Treponema endosymbiont of Eucomonympha sp.]